MVPEIIKPADWRPWLFCLHSKVLKRKPWNWSLDVKPAVTDTRNIRFRFKRFTATVHGLCINHYKSQWVNTGTLVDHRSFSQNRLTWSSYPQKRSSRFSPTTQIEPYSKYSTKTNEHNNAMKKNTTSTGVPVPSVCFCLVCLSLSLSLWCLTASRSNHHHWSITSV